MDAIETLADSINPYELLKNHIRKAAAHMRWARGLTIHAKTADANGDIIPSLAIRQAVISHQSQARGYGHIISATIKARTAVELAVVRGMVKDGEAAFWTGSCSGETCGDCDRPMWHHIKLVDDDACYQILCPFGRTFWQLARAIRDAAPNEDVAEYLYPIRIIAKR